MPDIHTVHTEENERIDYVNDKLSLIQKTDGLTFGTDALLLAGYINTRKKTGAELGSGSGIISLLLLTRDKLSSADCYEVQDTYAALTRRNAELNGLLHRLNSYSMDIRSYCGGEKYEVVYTNPPYMKCDSGRLNIRSEKSIARHEENGDINDFLSAGRKMLKWGGSFYIVYRPDRLCDLIYAMRSNKIEPKRMTLVYADTHSESSMVLIEGRRGGGGSLYSTPPLILYQDREHKKYTCDMEYILENGKFPDVFNKRL